MNIINPDWICSLISTVNECDQEVTENYDIDMNALTDCITDVFYHVNEEKLLPYIGNNICGYGLGELFFGALLSTLKEGDYYLAHEYSTFEQFLKKFQISTRQAKKYNSLYEKIVLGGIPAKAFFRVPWCDARSNVEYVDIDNWKSWRAWSSSERAARAWVAPNLAQ